MSVRTGGVAVPKGFDPAPAVGAFAAVVVEVSSTVPPEVDAVGVLVGNDGAVPSEVGHDRVALEAAGFGGQPGQTLVIPRSGGPSLVVVGAGSLASMEADALRDAAGSFARAAGARARLALVVPPVERLAPERAGQVATEGMLLARYSYDVLQTKPSGPALERVTLVGADDQAAGLAAGAPRGQVLAGACALARDLANCPPAHLTAEAMAAVAVRLGAGSGLEVEVFDEDALVELGCGGLLGVNAGSWDAPRMIKLTYHPPGGDPTGHLTLVGKGIMYDSGGISLKPADGTHATMKNDMSGAGAVLAAMTTLRAIDCRTAVTGYLMCTDNMPSGTALKMGDVLTMRGGTTVEVTNTDAEGRLVMGDALVLATEEPTDAIVDIATLTGAALRALGPEVAAVIGNAPDLVAQIQAASEASDEPVWELPLARRYRKYLDSDVADMNNLGGLHAGAITAALFLAELVGDHPWAHIDIAGTAQADAPDAWRVAGCTGFGARLLVELADSFTAPAR
jgi:leucyl aminopeptidase